MLINSSYACSYLSCLLSLHVNVFDGMFEECEMLTPMFKVGRSVDRTNKG